MNYIYIQQYLLDCGYEVSSIANNADEINALKVMLQIEDFHIELLHFFVDELIQLPIFLLNNASSFKRLAHTNIFNEFDIATICVNVPESVSINFERPELAFAESLERHITLLMRAITDDDWNEKELLREFEAGWFNLIENKNKKILCLSENNHLETLQILKPNPKINVGLSTFYLACPKEYSNECTVPILSSHLKNRNKSDALGFLIPIENLQPAPWTKEKLGIWYISLLESVSLEHFSSIRHERRREFWTIFNAETPSGRTWFGIHFSLKSTINSKKNLPLTIEKLKDWNLKAVIVSTFNKEKLMPRSGAEITLQDKKVLLVGCGSVGGEIADKLAASGIGDLVLCDPDYFSLNNLYRHILPIDFVPLSKAMGLKLQLSNKYPWIKVNYSTELLLNLRNNNLLKDFDLIIIAIGSPTHERLFHDFLLKNKITVPVIYSWVEGYGIGGHAILDIPNVKGCMRCAYTNPINFTRGLSSNLNFLADNQNLTKNHAGCGDAFLPYTFIASTQTAIIAVDLAVKYLRKKVDISSKVSWKGCSDDAISLGFKINDRYHLFTESLVALPLYNKGCDICNGEI